MRLTSITSNSAQSRGLLPTGALIALPTVKMSFEDGTTRCGWKILEFVKKDIKAINGISIDKDKRSTSENHRSSHEEMMCMK